MDPFDSSRFALTTFDERIQHTFQPRDEQPAAPSQTSGFGRRGLAPIAGAWRNLMTTLAVRPWVAEHRS
jgi:hypothetical protein